MSNLTSTLQVSCVDSIGNPIDLTAAMGVQLQFAILPKGIANLGPWSYKPMVVDIPPTYGVVGYQFSSSDLTPGNLVYAVQITFDNGEVLTSPNNVIDRIPVGATVMQTLEFSLFSEATVQFTRSGWLISIF